MYNPWLKLRGHPEEPQDHKGSVLRMDSSLAAALGHISLYPQEYVFIPRGLFVLDVPNNYFPPRLINRADAIRDQLTHHITQRFNVRDIEKPDLDFAAKYGRKSSFCLFNTNDRNASTQLISMLMKAKDLETFISTAAYVRDRVNPFLFQYAYSVAVQHRDDTSDMELPSIVSQFPGNFIEPSTLQDAREEYRIAPPTQANEKVAFEVPLNYTASDRDEEQRISYFREDIGVNMHHWHWHLVFPNAGPDEIVRKDRRGELFMYMHSQIIARYNLDRFCNNLGKTVPLSNLRDPIPEGYYPKLLQSVANRTYPARLPGQKLHDINRPDLLVSISDLERWTDRISGSIDKGYVFDDKGKRILLDERTGIDILGNIIESSSLSVNPRFYGNLHNYGHLIISYIHDPNLKYLEDYSVMGDTTTAMRDPIFYRWHTFINNLGIKHKAHLKPYHRSELVFDEIQLENIIAKCMRDTSEPNVMRTYWETSDVDIGVNLDFSPNPKDGLATFRFTHLMYEEFEYIITVLNKTTESVVGTCRIFLLPIDDERMVGLTLEEQRLLAVELDRFPLKLTPGSNRITRRSTKSSVTIPFTKIFQPRPTEPGDPHPIEECLKDLCSCGWPSHMLLPKGTAAGKVFKLFVMLSNDSRILPALSEYREDDIGSAFCGMKNKMYPDSRSMGFPFDRKLPAQNLDGLLQEYSNMQTCDLKIVFHE